MAGIRGSASRAHASVLISSQKPAEVSVVSSTRCWRAVQSSLHIDEFPMSPLWLSSLLNPEVANGGVRLQPTHLCCVCVCVFPLHSRGCRWDGLKEKRISTQVYMCNVYTIKCYSRYMFCLRAIRPVHVNTHPGRQRDKRLGTFLRQDVERFGSEPLAPHQDVARSVSRQGCASLGEGGACLRPCGLHTLTTSIHNPACTEPVRVQDQYHR